MDIAFFLGGGLLVFDRIRIWASMRWSKVGDFWNWMGFREEERYSTWTGLYSIAAFIFLMLIETPNWILSIAIAHLAFVDGFSKLGAIWPIAPLTIGDPQKSVGGFLAGFVLGGSCTGVHLFAFYSHIADTGTLLILLGLSTIVVSFLEVFDGGKYDNILIPLGSAGILAAFSPLIT